MSEMSVTIYPDDMDTLKKALTMYVDGLRSDEERERILDLLGQLAELSHQIERPEFKLVPSGSWN